MTLADREGDVRANGNRQAIWQVVGGASFFAFVALSLSNCTIRKPETKTPVPNETGVAKSMFVDKDGRKKTFVCGWAPIAESGYWGETAVLHGVNSADHCNLVFSIEENALVGRLINPSLPKDENRWTPIISIPIGKHYYYEKAKDDVNRDRNEMVENTSRSDWRARPNIDLNFRGTNMFNWGYSPFWGSSIAISSVEDIEIETKNEKGEERSYIAFTAHMREAGDGHNQQAVVRFNFMEYKHNSKFQPTPYNDRNSNLLNILHLVGQKAEGIYPIMYGARWDLEKRHPIYLYGFPKAYREFGILTVKEWNRALTMTTSKKGKVEDKDIIPYFTVQEKEPKYPFDLRYPTMHWVSDKRISSSSPLGIGMAAADVMNGEILWGGIVLYGGLIEQYVKAFTPSGSDSTASGKAARYIQDLPFYPTSDARMQVTHQLRPFIDNPQDLPRSGAAGGLEKILQQNWMARDLPVPLPQRPGEKLDAQPRPPDMPNFSAISQAMVEHASQILQERLISVKSTLDRTSTSVLFCFRTGTSDESRKRFQKEFGENFSQLSSQQKDAVLRDKAEAQIYDSSRTHFDLDRTFNDIGPGWSYAVNQYKIDSDQALQAVILGLIMHEYGHFLGMGHNFKENILPKEGTVPDSIYKELTDKATPENHYTNMTTIMGYPNPRSEVAWALADVKPGPQDILVLHYLYNQEYSTFKKGDSEFSFKKLPLDGKIPLPTQVDEDGSSVSYFDACNDFAASWSTDPYCNRFDRGFEAKSIIENYFEDIEANLVTSLNAFVEARGGNVWGIESSLWSRALTAMGRVRVFYDYMRQKYAPVFEGQHPTLKKTYFARNETNLMEFGEVCTGQLRNAELEELFANEPELKNLCEANFYAIEHYKKLSTFNGSDYSKMDFTNKYVSSAVRGGDYGVGDWSRWLGTWSEISALPIKISALHAVTTTAPYVPTWFGLFPIEQYGGMPGAGRYTYSTLYPKQFTQAMAAAVESNLNFSVLDPSRPTTIGQAVLPLGYFMDISLGTSNDQTKSFPELMMERVRLQKNFRLKFVALILSGKMTKDNTRAYSFTGQAYDFATQKLVPTGAVYIMPDARVLVKSSDRSFIYPVTQMKFYQKNEGYVFAYKMDYDISSLDSLAPQGIKAKLDILYNAVLERCTAGDKNGLETYFNKQPTNDDQCSAGTSPTFCGFDLSETLGEGQERKFLESINRSFETYYKTMKTSGEVCEEAMKGVSLIVSAAAVLNGYWLPEMGRVYVR